MHSRLVVAAACILAAAAPALAADRQVGEGKRYRTIQAAVDAADPGDRIVVSPGVYREQVFFQDKDGLRFVGRGAVWDGRVVQQSGTCLTFTANGVSVDGFTFRNGESHVLGVGEGNSIRRCVSRNAAFSSFVLDGGDGAVLSCRVSGAQSGGILVRGPSADVRGNRLANLGGWAIQVQDTDARVEANVVRNVRSGVGIGVFGDRAQVISNQVGMVGDAAVLVAGEDVVVRRNRCSDAIRGTALQVDGPRATVEDNRVNGTGDIGVLVDSDGMTVRRNRVTLTWRGAPAFLLANREGAAGATVADNVADRAGGPGFVLSLTNATVSRCVAIDCGRASAGAFLIGGNRSAYVGCRAETPDAAGFVVDGAELEFERCSARGAAGDGFRVRGPNDRFTDCASSSCGGEGFDNRGTETLLDGCTLTGNRIDLACDAQSGASFDRAARLALDNTWETGGPDRQPEVDD